MDSNCPICLYSVTPSDDAKIDCGHPIHLECAQSMHDTRCPVCRDELKSELLTEAALSILKERRSRYVQECRNDFNPFDWGAEYPAPVTLESLRSLSGGDDTYYPPQEAAVSLSGLSRDRMTFNSDGEIPTYMSLPVSVIERNSMIECGFEVEYTSMRSATVPASPPIRLEAALFQVRVWVKNLCTGAGRSTTITIEACREDVRIIREVLMRPGCVTDIASAYALCGDISRVPLPVMAKLIYNNHNPQLFERIREVVRSSDETGHLFGVDSRTPVILWRHCWLPVMHYPFDEVEALLVDPNTALKETKHQKKRERKRREKKNRLPNTRQYFRRANRNQHVRGATGKFRKTRR